MLAVGSDRITIPGNLELSLAFFPQAGGGVEMIQSSGQFGVRTHVGAALVIDRKGLPHAMVRANVNERRRFKGIECHRRWYLRIQTGGPETNQQSKRKGSFHRFFDDRS